MHAGFRSELLYKLVNNASDAILVTDSDCRIVYANHGVEQIFGWRSVDLINQSLDTLLPDAIGKAHQRDMHQFASSGPQARLMGDRASVSGRHRSGTEMPLEISIMSEVVDGKTMFAAIVRDVSQKLMREKALQRSETRLKRAQSIASMGSWDWTIQTNELWWSEEVYEIFGVSPADFSASYDAFLGFVHPEDLPAVKAAVEESLKLCDGYSIDHRIIRPDGEVRHVHEQGSVTLDDAGRPFILEGIVQDITERKAAEIELIWTRNEALSANAAKTQLLAMMSHELRTPLNAIIGFSDIMANEVFGPVGSEQYKGYLGDILSSGSHLLGLIQDILDAAMVEKSEIEKNETDFCLVTLLEETVRAVDLSALNGGGRIRIEIQNKPVRLFADRRMCRQMVSNLCRNALSYSPPGSEVLVSVAPAPDNGRLFVSVIDRGYGIPAGELERVTQQFVRLVHAEESEQHAGVGLGLYLVRAFVEGHGGKLELESRMGKGTCARLAFPAWRVNRHADS